MPAATMPPKDALQRLLDALQLFVREHLALARAEIKSDLRSMGGDLAVGAAGLPALAAGYLLLMLAISALLGLVLPAWAAYGIVALVNLGAGGAVTAAGIRRIRSERVDLPRTPEEMEHDRPLLSTGVKLKAAEDGAQPPGTPH
jgi:hypothetical protein